MSKNTTVSPAPSESSSKLTANECARLAARSFCALDTIRRYPNVREASRMRIERAAAEEGIDLARVTAARVAA